MSTTNPANDTVDTGERKRIPFGMPEQRLAIQDMPGWHLHWFLDTPKRIARAIQAGYEFVKDDEVTVNDRGLGTDGKDGNTDLGSNVSVLAGGRGEDNQAQRLILMKIKQEHWIEDQRQMEGEGSRLDGVRKALLAGKIGSDGQSRTDQAQTYLDTKRTKLPDFLEPKRKIGG